MNDKFSKYLIGIEMPHINLLQAFLWTSYFHNTLQVKCLLCRLSLNTCLFRIFSYSREYFFFSSTFIANGIDEFSGIQYLKKVLQPRKKNANTHSITSVPRAMKFTMHTFQCSSNVGKRYCCIFCNKWSVKSMIKRLLQFHVPV